MINGKRAREFEAKIPIKDRFPFSPYPWGWFGLAWNQDIKPNSIVREHAFGLELILWKDQGGEVRVFDAFCPHQGAHLVDGGLENNELVCPFHHWKFSTDGKCQTEVAKRAHCEGANLRSYPTRVHEGMVLFWYNPLQDHKLPPEKPLFEVQPRHNDLDWTPIELYDECNWVLESHIQEVLENSVDHAHFLPVHGAGLGTNPQPGTYGPGQAFIQTPLDADARALGFEGQYDITLRVKLNTLGMVQVETQVDEMGARFRADLYITPVDEERVRVRSPLYILKAGDQEATQELLDIWKTSFPLDMEKDMRIWEKKKYYHKPRLTQADGPVMQYRNWAQQFYQAPPAVLLEEFPSIEALSDLKAELREEKIKLENAGSRLREVIEEAKGNFQPQESKGMDVIIQHFLTGEGAENFYYHIHDEKLDVVVGEAENANLTFHCTVEDHVALAEGSLGGPRAFLTGRLKVRGDKKLANHMRKLFDYSG